MEKKTSTPAAWNHSSTCKLTVKIVTLLDGFDIMYENRSKQLNGGLALFVLSTVTLIVASS